MRSQQSSTERPASALAQRDGQGLTRAGRVQVEVLPEAEVGDQGSPLGREEDVLGLEIAVDDPLGVGLPDRVADL